MVHSSCLAPASTADKKFATAMPASQSRIVNIEVLSALGSETLRLGSAYVRLGFKRPWSSVQVPTKIIVSMDGYDDVVYALDMLANTNNEVVELAGRCVPDSIGDVQGRGTGSDRAGIHLGSNAGLFSYTSAFNGPTAGFKLFMYVGFKRP